MCLNLTLVDRITCGHPIEMKSISLELRLGISTRQPSTRNTASLPSPVLVICRCGALCALKNGIDKSICHWKPRKPIMVDNNMKVSGRDILSIVEELKHQLHKL